jgi:hypothetical protein
MFITRLKESEQAEVSLDFADAETIKLIIDFFYSAEIDVNLENAQAVATASEFLCCTDLKTHCGDAMSQNLSLTNCLEFWRFYKLYRMSNLETKSLDLILSEFVDFAAGDAFEGLTADELIRVISDDNLKVKTEDAVFQAVVRWVKVNREQREEHFPKLIEKVRFPYCSKSFLVYEVISEDPKLASSARTW